MAKPEETQVIVNLTALTLQALRAENGKIEAGGECVLENKASLEALMAAVAPSWKAEGIKAAAAVWPDGARWHLSTDTEAMLDRTADAQKAIAAAALKDPKAAMAYASCNANDGAAVTPDGMDKWVVASLPGEALAKVSARLSELKVASEGPVPAALPLAAAVSAAVRSAGKGAVAVWDLGSDQSTLLLVSASGVEGTVACEVGLASIFEAVQVALRLKFRGAGERLFFNETYDFTEAGPKVGATVGAKLRLALDQLPPSGNPPALACLGLTGKQAWFVREVAAAAGTTAWAPDMGKLAADLGVKFADKAVEASFSPATAGLLQLLSLRMKSSEAWQPAWVSVEAAPEEAPPAPIPEPEPEPVAPPPVARPAAPVRAKPSIAAEPAATPSPSPSRPKATLSSKPAGGPPPPPGAATATRAPMSIPASIDPPAPPAPSAPPPPSPAPPAARPEAPAPAPAPAMKFRAPPKPADTRPPSFSRPGFIVHEPEDFPAPPAAGAPPPPPGAAPGPAMPAPPGVPVPPSAPAVPGAPAPGAKPPPAVTALPFEVGKIKGAQTGQTTAPFPSTTAPFSATQAPFTTAPFPEAQPKSKAGFYIGLGVAAAVIFAVIAVVLDARMEKAKAYDLEQQEELAHHVAEQRLKEAEEARKEEEDQHNKELQSAIEITRKQTEEQTRKAMIDQLEEERLAKLPGTLLLVTTPPGASVSVDGAAPIRSPVKLDGIQPGKHRVSVTLAGHDPVELTADIKGSRTTNLGTVALQTSLGTLDLSSSPDGLSFAVRSAADPNGIPVRIGKTPATFEDIPHGDYVVTFSRPDCRDHVVKVSVAKGGTSPVATKYVDGSLELTSDPSGAWVDKDGERLGSTPLSIHDLTPKHAMFMLTLPGYDPTPITCDIPEGQTLKLDAQLLRKDRVFNASEVKTPPVSRETPPPVLTAAQRKQGGEAVVSFVVRLDGSVSDVTVVSASDDDIGRRCRAAVENWRYRAATAADDRLVDSKVEVPFKFPPGGQ